MEKFNYKPTKPKDASTLIIIRKNKKKTFVLMGQRPMQSRFMPGVYVFPGGVTEKEMNMISFLKAGGFAAINYFQKKRPL